MLDRLGPHQHRIPSQSRRTAVQVLGGALLASAWAAPLPARAQGTPEGGQPGGDLMLVQSYSHGSLFPTQGDVGAVPYTLTLWDAAKRGLVYVARQAGAAGLAPTEALIAAITAGERPRAALVAPSPAGDSAEQVWALRLAYGGLGSDPGAVTYQGKPIPEEEATAWLGVTPKSLPKGPQDLAAGYLIITGLPTIDLPDRDRLHMDLG